MLDSSSSSSKTNKNMFGQPAAKMKHLLTGRSDIALNLQRK